MPIQKEDGCSTSIEAGRTGLPNQSNQVPRNKPVLKGLAAHGSQEFDHETLSPNESNLAPGTKSILKGFPKKDDVQTLPTSIPRQDSCVSGLPTLVSASLTKNPGLPLIYGEMKEPEPYNIFKVKFNYFKCVLCTRWTIL